MVERKMEFSESDGSVNNSRILLQQLKREFIHNIPIRYARLSKKYDSGLAGAFNVDGVESGGFSQSFNTDILLEKIWVKNNFPKNGLPRERWKEFQEEKAPLTKMGQFIREKIADDTLIDLGSGVGRKVILTWVEIFGAKRYIGVDTEETDSVCQREDFTEFRIKEDMLLFVAKLPDNYGSFYISGIEDLRREVINYNVGYSNDLPSPNLYLGALFKEISRATRPGGLLIIGANTSSPYDPQTRGFKRIYFEDSHEDDDKKENWVYIKEENEQ